MPNIRPFPRLRMVLLPNPTALYPQRRPEENKKGRAFGTPTYLLYHIQIEVVKTFSTFRLSFSV